MWFTKPKTAKPKVIESMVNFTYPVSVRRSSRRCSIELRVTGNGQVRLLCPLAMTDSQICAFIDSKASWIQSKLQQSAFRQTKTVPSVEEGARWQFRGHTLQLKLGEGQEQVVAGDTHLNVLSNTGDFKGALKAWYFAQAEDYLLERTRQFSKQMNLSPRKVQLKTYRSMWGRCNSRHEIAYDWRVIQAPDSVIDYLVVHELAHLRHFNHSPAFWQLVGLHLPTFQDAKQWLRDNAYWVKQTLGSD